MQKFKHIELKADYDRRQALRERLLEIAILCFVVGVGMVAAIILWGG